MMATQTMTQPASLLWRAVRANSVFCGTSGIGILLLAAPISDVLGVTDQSLLASLTGVPFLQMLGGLLMAYAVMLFMLTRQLSRIPTEMALPIVALDVAWVALSALVIVTDVWTMTVTGNIIVAVLADIVLLFVLVQSWGLYRRSRE